jgi:branched-chain amino acid transport system ATP-binding protein
MRKNFFWQMRGSGPLRNRKRSNTAPRSSEIIDFLEIQHIRKHAGGPAALWVAKARRTWTRAGDGTGLLLLDEPMAGMNLEEKEDMSRFILDVNQTSSAPPSR